MYERSCAHKMSMVTIWLFWYGAAQHNKINAHGFRAWVLFYVDSINSNMNDWMNEAKVNLMLHERKKNNTKVFLNVFYIFSDWHNVYFNGFVLCVYRLSYEFLLLFFSLLIGINEWLLEYAWIHKQNTNQRMKTIWIYVCNV